MPDFDIDHIAQLANLALGDDEKQKLQNDLSMILEMVEQINEVNTDGVDETLSVNNLTNVSRDDVVKPSLELTDVLKEAPSANAGYIKVPKVFD